MLTRACVMLLLLGAAAVMACGDDRTPEGAADITLAAASRTLSVKVRGMVKKLGIT